MHRHSLAPPTYPFLLIICHLTCRLLCLSVIFLEYTRLLLSIDCSCNVRLVVNTINLDSPYLKYIKILALFLYEFVDTFYKFGGCESAILILLKTVAGIGKTFFNPLAAIIFPFNIQQNEFLILYRDCWKHSASFLINCVAFLHIFNRLV